MFPVVVIRQPGHTPIHLQVREAIEVGRECSGVIVDDPQVSRRHLVLAPTKSGGPEVAVLDLGSLNGTLLGGVRLRSEAIVRPGQEVRFGETTLQVLVDDHAGVVRPTPSPMAEPGVANEPDVADEHAPTTVVRAQPAPPRAAATPEQAWARPHDDTGKHADATGEADPDDPWR
jgi:pSer/pThr/pTyr-binding forkhead associated (FHA) protein